MADEVLTEVSDGVAVITINRPQARNAVNGAVARGIGTAVAELDARKDVQVLILTGAGGTFSAGMDLKGFLTGDSPHFEDRGFGGIVQRPPAKPVIAAVEGYALAGGFELVLSCDLIVASEEAKFALPESGAAWWRARAGCRGCPPDSLSPGHGDRLHRRALPGRSAADGRPGQPAGPGGRGAVGGDGARRPDRGKASARAHGDQTRDRRVGRLGHAEAFRQQGEIINPVFGSADAMEGALAFAEKRPPVWSGE